MIHDTKYEYLVATFDMDARKETEELNAWGEAGWELVTIQFEPTKRFYFKRPRPRD